MHCCNGTQGGLYSVAMQWQMPTFLHSQAYAGRMCAHTFIRVPLRLNISHSGRRAFGCHVTHTHTHTLSNGTVGGAKSTTFHVVKIFIRLAESEGMKKGGERENVG